MEISNVSGLAHQWGLIPSYCFRQTCSRTHGHIGLQTFLRVTSSLKWNARQKEMTPLQKITIYVVFLFPSFSLPCTTSLTINNFFQVESVDTDRHKNFIPTCIGCLIMLKEPADHVSANTVTLAEHRRRSMPFFHSHQTRKLSKDPKGPRNTRKQGNNNAPGVLPP